MEYTLENPSDKPVKGSLTGIWETPVLAHTRRKRNAELRFTIIGRWGCAGPDQLTRDMFSNFRFWQRFRGANYPYSKINQTIFKVELWIFL